MSSEMRSFNGIVSLTPGGDKLGEKLLKQMIEMSPDLNWVHFNSQRVKEEYGGIKKLFETRFQMANAWIFIGAAGIAVRAVAPVLEDKFKDPALIVMDEAGRFVISLLSGHAGGANELVENIGLKINSMPVVTTATDVLGVSSLDLVLKGLHVRLADYRALILKANMALASGERVALWVDERFLESIQIPFEAWQPRGRGIDLYSSFEALSQSRASIKVYVGTDPKAFEQLRTTGIEQVIPRVYVLGTGSKKNLEAGVYMATLEAWLAEQGICPQAISAAASIDLKSEEVCMQVASKQYQWEMHFYVPEVLLDYEGHFDLSEWVKQTTGIGSVSGPCALKLLNGNRERLIGDSYKGNGCTFTLGRIKP